MTKLVICVREVGENKCEMVAFDGGSESETEFEGFMMVQVMACLEIAVEELAKEMAIKAKGLVVDKANSDLGKAVRRRFKE